MPRGDGFRVAIKGSARRSIDAKQSIDDPGSDVLEFQSREVAEAAVETGDLSGAVGLQLQRPAPNDPTDVDAYLVAYPETRKRSPDGSLEEGWTFDVTANQYGALGEALVTVPGSPALRHFVSQDLSAGGGDSGVPGDRYRVEIETNPERFDRETLRSAPTDGQLRWVPDCEARVTLPDRRGHVHRYFCEIKTGNESLERNQAADLAAVAAVADVLEIRVDIDGLPESYTVTFRRVGEATPDSRVTLDLSGDDSVAGDQTGLSEFRE